MKTGRALRGAVRWGVGMTGYELVSKRGDALGRLREHGVEPTTVVDVGAALGDWTRACAATFPKARYVMVEPLEEFLPALEEAAASVGGTIVRAAASSETGVRMFNVHRDLVGSSLKREREGATVDGAPREVEVTTIDAIISVHGLKPPYLLKLDVQGAELDALAGARTALRQTVAVVAEASFLDFYFGGTSFEELVAAMAGRDFVVYDFVSLSHRPADGALAQSDVVFLPRDSPLRAFKGWATVEQRAAQDDEFAAAMQRRLRHARRRR